MTSVLFPCASCSRHILSTEDNCPFCGTPVVAVPPRRRLPKGRLSRAALVAWGTLTACGGAAVEEKNRNGNNTMGDGDGDESSVGGTFGDGDSPGLVYGLPASGGSIGSGGVPQGTGGLPVGSGGTVYGSPATGGTFNEGGMGGDTTILGDGDGDVSNGGVSSGGVWAAGGSIYGTAPSD